MSATRHRDNKRAVGAGGARARIARAGNEMRLFRAIQLVFLAVLVVLGVRFGGILYREWRGPLPVVSPAAEPEGSTTAFEAGDPDAPSSHYRPITDHRLLGGTYGSRPASDVAHETGELKRIGIAGEEAGLKLIGTTIGTERHMNHAVLEVVKDRRQQIVSEGEMIGGVRVKRIWRNNVVIETAAVAAIAQTELGSKADRDSTDLTVEISLNELAQALPEIRQRLEGPNSSTNRPAGRPEGFYLSRVVAVDALYHIGLRTGDVIKSIDGKEVGSLDDADVLLHRLEEGGQFAILIERRGQPHTLSLSIN